MKLIPADHHLQLLKSLNISWVSLEAIYSLCISLFQSGNYIFFLLYNFIPNRAFYLVNISSSEKE